jgi:Spy/CpxP family protein refolding chaperone
MAINRLVIGIALSALAASAYLAIADDATPTPETTTKEPKLISPYNLLTDLTPDQTAKIEDIHKQELEAEKILKQKETEDINAVLTDAQKKELAEAASKLAAEKSAEKKATADEIKAKLLEDKAKAMQDKANGLGATSQPAGK